MARPRVLRLYPAAVQLVAVGLALWSVLAGEWDGVLHHLGPVIFWVVACAGSNLLPAPVQRNVDITMTSPVDIATAYLFPPGVAAIVVGIGSLTSWELHREIKLSHATFNRSQLALSAAAASWIDRSHGLAHLGVGRYLVAILGYNLMNVGLVSLADRAWYGTRLTDAFRRIVEPVASFAVSYLILGVLGVIFAVVYMRVGWWAVAPFLIPLLSARYALRHSKELEQAQRERAALGDKLIDERERERARIASDMHDLVLQRLAAAQMMADNVNSALGAGHPELATQLASTVKEEVAGAIADIRTAIADLRRAAIDGTDLGGTLDRYARAFRAETALDVHVDVDGVAPGDLPLPVALLLYECTQEALTNVVRHAGANRVDILLHRLGDSVELKVRDDGRGPSPNGQGGVHLGLTLTKDKVALVGGGAWFEGIEGGGAQVIVRIPVRGAE